MLVVLATKLEKKIAQTRKGEAKGILLVQQPDLGDEEQLKISFGRIQGKLFSSHKNLTGALIVRRTYKRGILPYYHGNVLINQNEDSELLNKLIEYEWQYFSQKEIKTFRSLRATYYENLKVRISPSIGAPLL